MAQNKPWSEPAKVAQWPFLLGYNVQWRGPGLQPGPGVRTPVACWYMRAD